ncbi:MAG: hypothetical protein K8T26_06395 [Lentisphaerae bacterium]|nr:hypothetical protein [Lentisphaerota bacterium]
MKRQWLTAMLLAMTAAVQAAPTNLNWVVAGTGAWESAESWDPSVVPGRELESLCAINNGGTAVVSQPGQSAAFVTLGVGVATTGTVELAGGDLTTGSALNVGRSGWGRMVQRTGTACRVVGNLFVGEGATGPAWGEYALEGGLLSVGGSDGITVGYKADATGGVTQTGGTIDALAPTRYLMVGRLAGSVGRYTLQDGAVQMTNNNFIVVGESGRGAWEQRDGQLAVDQYLHVGRKAGGQGNLSLAGGLAQAGYLVLGEQGGGTGEVVVAGGELRIGERMYVGRWGTGTLRQTGGVVTVTNEYVYLADQAGGEGAWWLDGGGALLLTNGNNHLFVGERGSGTFSQSNGAVAVRQYLITGRHAGSRGAYELAGGSCTTEYLVIGEDGGATGVWRMAGGTLAVGQSASVGKYGDGLVVQTGGTLTITNEYLYVGEQAGSMGRYELSGDGQVALTQANNYLFVGEYGHGEFVQSNGAVAVKHYVVAGRRSGGTGRYEISGGSLDVGGWLVVGEAATATGVFAVVGGDSTVAVHGEYRQNACSTLELTLQPEGLTPIAVDSIATLAGALRVRTEGVAALPAGASVTVLHAGELFGTFATTNVSAPLVHVDVRYDPFLGVVTLTNFVFAPQGPMIQVR